MSNKIYYGQHLEDKYIIENFFKNKTNGFFVELGALDGIQFSNTYYLENHMNWRGVLIEPTLSEYNKLINNRSKSKCFNCAISSNKDNVILYNYGHNAMNRITDHKHDFFQHKSTLSVKAYPISEILHKAKVKEIDFFSIDVEGAELEVLESMDWDIPVHVILAEIKTNANTHPISNIKNIKCRNFLKSKGFIYHSSTCCDEVWVNPNYKS
jgi:FkbM family methyltransferase